VIAVVSVLLAAAPVQARFALEVAGLPLAELRVTVSNNVYIYESTHFLEEGPRERRVELELKEGTPQPEVLALLRRPKMGCRDVLEERERKLEKLCITKSVPGEVTGTIAKETFTASYDSNDALTSITVGSARWFAVAQAVQPPTQSPFVQGVAVPPGELRLDPPVEGAKWLAKAPIGTGKEGRRARCLILAREEAAKRPGATVSVGLVIEDGRAYPHAWVTQKGAAFDPSVLEGDPILKQRRYLELPKAKSGDFYLRFFDGAARLVAK
jgi:hypothetical protein